MIEYALADKDGRTYQSRSDAGDSSNSRRGINPLSGPLHGGTTTSNPRSDADGSSNSKRQGWCSDWPTREVEPNGGLSPCTKRDGEEVESGHITFLAPDSVPDWDNVVGDRDGKRRKRFWNGSFGNKVENYPATEYDKI
jgi:hypothetical protein